MKTEKSTFRIRDYSVKEWLWAIFTVIWHRKKFEMSDKGYGLTLVRFNLPNLTIRKIELLSNLRGLKFASVEHVKTVIKSNRSQDHQWNMDDLVVAPDTRTSVFSVEGSELADSAKKMDWTKPWNDPYCFTLRK